MIASLWMSLFGTMSGVVWNHWFSSCCIKLHHRRRVFVSCPGCLRQIAWCLQWVCINRTVVSAINMGIIVFVSVLPS